MLALERFSALGAFVWLGLRGRRISSDSQLDGPSCDPTTADTWRKRMRYRWHLRRLLRDCPELIEDAGLSLEEAVRQSEKPFWRA